jgi:hypothetical protein
MEFRFSRKKLIPASLAAVVMVAASYFCTTLADASARAFGWVGVVFFGAAFVVISTRLFNTQAQVIVNDAGIEQRRNRLGVIAWTDITSVRVASIGAGNKFLCLNLANPQKYLADISNLSRKVIAFNESKGFSPISIGFTGLSPSIEEAVSVIRSRYGIRIE